MDRYLVTPSDEIIFEEIFDDLDNQEAYEKGYKEAYEFMETAVEDAYDAGREDGYGDHISESYDDLRNFCYEILESDRKFVDAIIKLFLLRARKHGNGGTVEDALDHLKMLDQELYCVFAKALDQEHKILKYKEEITNGYLC